MRPLVTMQPATGAPLDNSKILRTSADADGDILEDRIEQAGHGFLHLVDQLVNDRVKLDLHAFVLGLVGHAAVDAGVEAQNDRVRSRGQRHVRLGDGADGAVDDFQRDLVGLDLLEAPPRWLRPSPAYRP